MKNNESIKVINPDNDFFIVQNYILQLHAEKKITSDAFVLYSFYKSLSGMSIIQCGYKYIKANTGLSHGSISKSNRILINLGLIKIKNMGTGSTHVVEVKPGHQLPRRRLNAAQKNDSKKICSSRSPNDIKTENQSLSDQERSPDDQKMEKRSPHDPIYIMNKNIHIINNTTTGEMIGLTKDQVRFLNKFKKEWQNRNKTNYYPKDDLYKILEIKDPKEAMKYIPILWSLDENDNWVKNSDHSLTIFLKEYKIGKLQSVYQNSWQHLQDQNQ